METNNQNSNISGNILPIFILWAFVVLKSRSVCVSFHLDLTTKPGIERQCFTQSDSTRTLLSNFYTIFCCRLWKTTSKLRQPITLRRPRKGIWQTLKWSQLEKRHLKTEDNLKTREDSRLVPFIRLSSTAFNILTNSAVVFYPISLFYLSFSLLPRYYERCYPRHSGKS